MLWVKCSEWLLALCYAVASVSLILIPSCNASGWGFSPVSSSAMKNKSEIIILNKLLNLWHDSSL